jgi:hypothetical protein
VIVGLALALVLCRAEYHCWWPSERRWYTLNPDGLHARGGPDDLTVGERIHHLDDVDLPGRGELASESCTGTAEVATPDYASDVKKSG